MKKKNLRFLQICFSRSVSTNQFQVESSALAFPVWNITQGWNPNEILLELIPNGLEVTTSQVLFHFGTLTTSALIIQLNLASLDRDEPKLTG